MATIQEARVNAVLDKLMNYDVFGVITRREYVKKALSMGYTVSVVMRPDRTAVNKAERVLSSEAFGSRMQEAKAILENPPLSPEYRMNYRTGYWLDITKTEYDFALTLAPAVAVPVEVAPEVTEPVSTPLLPQVDSPALLDTLAQGMREHKAKSEYIKILSVKVDFDKLDTVTLEVPTLYCLLNSIKGFLQDSLGMDEERDRQLSAVEVSLETLRSMERVARDRDIQKRRRSRAAGA